MGLLHGPRSGRFVLSEVPLYPAREEKIFQNRFSIASRWPFCAAGFPKRGVLGDPPPATNTPQIKTERQRSATVKVRIWRSAFSSKMGVDREGSVRQLIKKEREGRGQRERKREKRGGA